MFRHSCVNILSPSKSPYNDTIHRDFWARPRAKVNARNLRLSVFFPIDRKMKSDKLWVQALGLSAQDVNSWKERLPQGESLTVFALKNKLISSKDYFAWAKSEYGLAYLKADFFQQPWDENLWESLKSVANWSPHFFPIHQWDGVVFIACSEPTSKYNGAFQLNICWPTLLKWRPLEKNPSRNHKHEFKS